MLTCPFCKSDVDDEAVVCRGCHAEKENTFGGNLNRAIKQMGSTTGMMGFIGMLLGFALGVGTGMQLGQFMGWVVGIVVCVLVTISPALIKTALFTRNKTIWYR